MFEGCKPSFFFFFKVCNISDVYQKIATKGILKWMINGIIMGIVKVVGDTLCDSRLIVRCKIL